MTEGEKFRGTTSVWRILTAFSLTPSSNGLRDIGRTRLPLLLFREATPGGIWASGNPLPRTKRQLSENSSEPTVSHQRVNGVILAKKHRFVKKIFQLCSISSALFRVVSVIFVPPMIRASSRFLPSVSKGVTEV